MPGKIITKMINAKLDFFFAIASMVSMWIGAIMADNDISLMFVFIGLACIFLYIAAGLEKERLSREKREKIRAELRKQLLEIEQECR